MKKIVIASSKSWFREKTKIKSDATTSVFFISQETQLNAAVLEEIEPDFIFFPHWSFKIPKAIHENFKCIIFHTAPLPIGRGGSPIQNLILNGAKEAPVCALDVVEKIDAGAVYVKQTISLSGSLDQIFDRLADAIDKQITFICNNEINPLPQAGVPTYFKRLNKTDNELPGDCSIEELYDRIRMVDADEYSPAYLHFGNFLFEFRDAEIHGGTMTVRAEISEK